MTTIASTVANPVVRTAGAILVLFSTVVLEGCARGPKDSVASPTWKCSETAPIDPKTHDCDHSIQANLVRYGNSLPAGLTYPEIDDIRNEGTVVRGNTGAEATSYTVGPAAQLAQTIEGGFTAFGPRQSGGNVTVGVGSTNQLDASQDQHVRQGTKVDTTAGGGTAIAAPVVAPVTRITPPAPPPQHMKTPPQPYAPPPTQHMPPPPKKKPTEGYPSSSQRPPESGSSTTWPAPSPSGTTYSK